MTTLTALRNEAPDGPATAQRKSTAEALLKRNLGITDSARERVRTKLAGVEIEDSPIKQRDGPRGRRDEQVNPPPSPGPTPQVAGVRLIGINF